MAIGMQLALGYAEYSGHRGPAVPALGGDQMLKKIITWAIVIFIVYYLATQPTGAAHFVHGVFNWLKDAGKSLSTFVNSL
jgi:hypothetical protein